MGRWARRFSVLALVAASAASLSPWQTAMAQSGRLGVSSNGTLYQSVEPALVQDVLQELGFETTVTDASEGGRRQFIVLALQGDMIFLVNLRACDVPDMPRGCLGMDFFTTWKVRRGAMNRAVEGAASYNDEQPFGRVVVNREENAVYFSHYVITDGGISRENILSYTSLFMGASTALTTEYLDGLLETDANAAQLPGSDAPPRG